MSEIRDVIPLRLSVWRCFRCVFTVGRDRPKGKGEDEELRHFWLLSLWTHTLHTSSSSSVGSYKPVRVQTSFWQSYGDWRHHYSEGYHADKSLACAFVAGLPESVRQLLRAGSRMESLDLPQILPRASRAAVVRDDGTGGGQEVYLAARTAWELQDHQDYRGATVLLLRR